MSEQVNDNPIWNSLLRHAGAAEAEAMELTDEDRAEILAMYDFSAPKQAQLQMWQEIAILFGQPGIEFIRAEVDRRKAEK